MAKEGRTQVKNPQNTAGPGLMVRVEYVGVIAIACLLIGAVVGSSMSGGGGKITVDTAASPPADVSTAMPTEEVIQHLMDQIGSTRNYDSLVRMGNMAMDRRMTAVAVAAYEKALSIHPGDPNVITDLGAVYNDQMNQPKKALELFERAAKLDPKHVQSRYNAGIANLDLNNKAAAEKAFREVIRIAPDSEQAQEAGKQLEQLKNTKR